MTELVIVRHGNTFGPDETARRVGAHTDLPLVASGRDQAAALGAHFTKLGWKFQAALSSPLQRTRLMADIILKHTGFAGEIEMASMLREIDYGPDENRTEPEVVARLGQDAIDKWNAEAAPPNGWRVDPAAIIATWAALFERLANGDPDRRVLAVTSNGIARFVLDAAVHDGELPRKLRTGAYGRIRSARGYPARILDWDVRP